eukprot:TRINITY_DN22866_c0_g1_i1.p1 TRINITY_DN22866_c0_g1~~TRINITY_DN22866_c0_g1_i1.p1  ORF type:complete len:124 (-),score=7.10 TRINITY_DN22866_c0_g1_i1:17-388(-)
METVWFSKQYRYRARKAIEREMKIYDYVAVFCGIGGAIISAIENELYWKQVKYVTDSGLFQRDEPENSYCSFLRAMISILTVPLIFCLYKRYQCALRLMKAQLQISTKVSLYRSKLFLSLIHI